MAGDWLSITTFVDLQLSTIRRKKVAAQNMVITELFEYFSKAQHLEDLSAIAWDLVIPLSHFIKSSDSKPAALKLFNLAVEHGNQKEVLLKLIEALELIDLGLSEDAAADLELQLTLLKAQETILKKIRTKKPTLFMAEYTKSMLKALRSASMQSQVSGAIDSYTNHISTSLEHGALYHLQQDNAATESERHSVNSLLRSFMTYVVEISTVMPAVPFSFELFLEHHPRLAVPINSSRSVPICKHVHDRFSEQLRLHFDDMKDLWECGELAREEIDVSGHESDQDSDSGLVEGDVPLSATGSVILLAKLLREQRSVKAHEPDFGGIDLPTRLEKCQEILMGLCIQQNPNDTTLDAALYICGLVLAELPKTASLSESDDQLILIQMLSSISATAAHPELRQVAHYLSKDALAASTDRFKLDYYTGVLEDCPFEALKSATVGMIKDEIARNTEFWTKEEILLPLLDKILVLEHDRSREMDDIRVQFCVQTINLIIFLLQRFPNSEPIRFICREWIDALKIQLAATDRTSERPETNSLSALFDMYLARTEELLI